MDRFEILNPQLGKGYFGSAQLVKRLVWKKQNDNKKFVVKVIPQAVNSDEKTEANKAIDILKGLQHQNIVRLINLYGHKKLFKIRGKLV